MTPEQLLEDVRKYLSDYFEVYDPQCDQAARDVLAVAIEACAKVAQEEAEKQKILAASSKASERFHLGAVAACHDVEVALIALKPKD